MIFGLLYDLCHTLYNPFGPRSIDIPHGLVGGGIRRMAREFAKGCVPPTMENGSCEDMEISFGDASKKNEEFSYPRSKNKMNKQRVRILSISETSRDSDELSV